VHGFSKENYTKLYGSTICSASQKKYGSTGNFNWISRKKDKGEDLSAYKSKMSEAVSCAIISNEKERTRRSKLLGSLNKRRDFRERSSRIAKITSSRPEILSKRTAQLRKWRIEHPEEFQETLTKILKNKSSKPEKILFEICKTIFGDSTIRQLQIHHTSIPNKSNRARVDIANKEHKILVEFDGPFHFLPIAGEKHLQDRIARDLAVEKYAVENEYVLLRISHDLFDGLKFDDCVLAELENARFKKSCVLRIGKFYADEK